MVSLIWLLLLSVVAPSGERLRVKGRHIVCLLQRRVSYDGALYKSLPLHLPFILSSRSRGSNTHPLYCWGFIEFEANAVFLLDRQVWSVNVAKPSELLGLAARIWRAFITAVWWRTVENPWTWSQGRSPLKLTTVSVLLLSRVSALTRDIDIPILSVCPSVCPFVTRWYCMKTVNISSQFFFTIR